MREEVSSRDVSIWAEICWAPGPIKSQLHFLGHVVLHRLVWTKATVCPQSSTYFHIETFDGDTSLHSTASNAAQFRGGVMYGAC